MPEHEFPPPRRPLAGPYRPGRDDEDPPAWANLPPGEEVVLFGPGDDGEPTAQEWGEVLGTISYDIATGIGARVPLTYPAGGH